MPGKKYPTKMDKPADGHPKMMAPKKLKTGVGLHGPFKMVMGMHNNVSPGPMKMDHVQKFSYMYPQGNKFIGAKVKAEKAGKDSFTVNGKEYQVRMEKPLDGHSEPMEHHGPKSYHGPNMADMPTPMDGHGEPMKYPREDYTEKASGTFKDDEKKDEGNGNGNGDDKKDNGKKDDGPPKPPTASENLANARKRRRDARRQLKANRLNRRASRMEARAK